METISRIGFADDRGAVEGAVIEAVEHDPNGYLREFVEDSRSLGGRFICSDLMKEQFPQFSIAKDGRQRYDLPVHNAAVALASEQLRRTLANRPQAERNTVLFLIGIPGAGKTTSVLRHGFFPSNCHAIYEGQLLRSTEGIAKIQMTLDAGYRSEVVVIHTLPENALVNTIRRFNEYGRGANLNVLADIQANLPGGLMEVQKHFGDDVTLHVVDKRDRPNTRRYSGWEYLKILESEGSYDRIKQRLVEPLELISPNISEAAYRQARGREPMPLMFDRSMAVRSGGYLPPRGNHYGRGTPGDRGPTVLSPKADGIYNGPILTVDDKSVLQLTPDGFVLHERIALSGGKAIQQGKLVSVRYAYERVGFVREASSGKTMLGREYGARELGK